MGHKDRQQDLKKHFLKLNHRNSFSCRKQRFEVSWLEDALLGAEKNFCLEMLHSLRTITCKQDCLTL